MPKPPPIAFRHHRNPGQALRFPGAGFGPLSGPGCMSNLFGARAAVASLVNACNTDGDAVGEPGGQGEGRAGV